jgi:hypothetical protein
VARLRRRKACLMVNILEQTIVVVVARSEAHQCFHWKIGARYFLATSSQSSGPPKESKEFLYKPLYN